MIQGDRVSQHRWVLPLVLLAAGWGAYAQVAAGGSSNLRFEYLDVQDGLSNSYVSAIVQDPAGFLWFGTKAGLNRYDGYGFKHFSYIPFETDSLSHSQIQTMYVDDNGYLWVGTYGGLNRFDPRSEEVHRFVSDIEDDTTLSNNVVIAVLADSAGRLWVGTGNGLNLSHNDGKTFTRYLPDPEVGSGTRKSG